MRNLILLTLALLALAAMADSTYTFRVVMTEEIWDGKDFSPTDWIFDDDGTPWIIGSSDWVTDSLGGFQWELISDTLGNIDTLCPNTGKYYRLGNYILEKFRHLSYTDTIIAYGHAVDTIVPGKSVFDSLVVTPIFGGEASWKYTYGFIEPLIIAKNGWSLVTIYKDPIAESLFPGWKCAIAHDGEIDEEIDIDKILYPDTDFCKLKGSYFAVRALDSIGPGYQYDVYDTSGDFKFSSEHMNFQSLFSQKFDLLSDGSLLYVAGTRDSAVFKRKDASNEWSYPINDTTVDGVIWGFNQNKILLEAYPATHWRETTKCHLYYLELEDSIEHIWNYPIDDGVYRISILDTDDILVLSSPPDSMVKRFQILSPENGNEITDWLSERFEIGLNITTLNNWALVITNEHDAPDSLLFRLVNVEGGE